MNINDLIELLWGFITSLVDDDESEHTSASKITPKTQTNNTQISKSIEPKSINELKYVNNIPGFKRMQVANKELQQIAQKILNNIRHQPLGTLTPFQHNGVKYVAALEEHYDSNRGAHPGISLFIDEKSKSNLPSSVSSIDKLSGLNPRLKMLAQKFLQEAKNQGIDLVITSGFRSNAEQERLYQQGRTTPGGIVTHAKPGQSNHNHGLAFDVAPLNESGKPYWPNDEQLWENIGRIGESVGLRWGGRWKSFKDRPHFEISLKSASRYNKTMIKRSKNKSKKDKNRVDKDVRPFLIVPNYDYAEPGLGTGLYNGPMNRFKSVKDFLNKSRKQRKKKRLKLLAEIFGNNKKVGF